MNPSDSGRDLASLLLEHLLVRSRRELVCGEPERAFSGPSPLEQPGQAGLHVEAVPLRGYPFTGVYVITWRPCSPEGRRAWPPPLHPPDHAGACLITCRPP